MVVSVADEPASARAGGAIEQAAFDEAGEDPDDPIIVEVVGRPEVVVGPSFEWEIDTDNARMASSSTLRGWDGLPAIIR